MSGTNYPVITAFYPRKTASSVILHRTWQVNCYFQCWRQWWESPVYFICLC